MSEKVIRCGQKKQPGHCLVMKKKLITVSVLSLKKACPPTLQKGSVTLLQPECVSLMSHSVSRM